MSLRTKFSSSTPDYVGIGSKETNIWTDIHRFVYHSKMSFFLCMHNHSLYMNMVSHPNPVPAYHIVHILCWHQLSTLLFWLWTLNWYLLVSSFTGILSHHD